MKDVLEQISLASSSGLYYVALLSALTVPDICGALGAPNGEATGKRYVAWYDAHVASQRTGMVGSRVTGQEVYWFRCSLLHQGRAFDRRSGFSRIVFVEPEATTNVFHNCTVGDALLIDVRLFVNEVVRAASTWLAGVQGKEPFASNYAALVTRHPNGLQPYISGVSVIG